MSYELKVLTAQDGQRTTAYFAVDQYKEGLAPPSRAKTGYPWIWDHDKQEWAYTMTAYTADETFTIVGYTNPKLNAVLYTNPDPNPPPIIVSVPIAPATGEHYEHSIPVPITPPSQTPRRTHRAKAKKASGDKKKPNLFLIVIAVIVAIAIFSNGNGSSANGTIPQATPIVTTQEERQEPIRVSSYARPEPPTGENINWLPASFVSAEESGSGMIEYELDPDDDTMIQPGETLYIRDPLLFYAWSTDGMTISVDELARFDIESDSTFHEGGNPVRVYITALANRYRQTTIDTDHEFKIRYNNAWYHDVIEYLRVVEAFIAAGDFTQAAYDAHPELFQITFSENGEYDLVDIDEIEKILAGDSGSKPLPYIPPNFTPTTTTTPAPSEEEKRVYLYDDLVEIVGHEAADTAFTTNNPNTTYFSYEVEWEDFTDANRPLNTILRQLGPTGWQIIQKNDGTFAFRSFAKNGNGFAAEVTIIDTVPLTFTEGDWQIRNPPGQLHWERAYPSDIEITIGAASLYPVYHDQDQNVPNLAIPPTAIPYKPASPAHQTIDVDDLPQYMNSAGIKEIKSYDCPPEPLTGNIALNDEVTVNFAFYAAATIKYSQTSCISEGGLTFYHYNPGQDIHNVSIIMDSVYGDVYIWPMTAQVAHINAIGEEVKEEEIPAPGSQISLEELIEVMGKFGQNDNIALCSDVNSGSIPGWPNAVSIDVNVVDYTVDFSPISNMVDESTLCKAIGATPGKHLWMYSTDGQTSAPTFHWGGWYFAPAK